MKSLVNVKPIVHSGCRCPYPLQFHIPSNRCRWLSEIRIVVHNHIHFRANQSSWTTRTGSGKARWAGTTTRLPWLSVRRHNHGRFIDRLYSNNSRLLHFLPTSTKQVHAHVDCVTASACRYSLWWLVTMSIRLSSSSHPASWPSSDLKRTATWDCHGQF